MVSRYEIVVSTNTCTKCSDGSTDVGEVGAVKVTNKFKFMKMFQVCPGIVMVLLSWPGRGCRTDDPQWLD